MYTKKASWNVQHLTNAYVVVDFEKGKNKFDFKLDSQFVCNGCYALALRYSKMRLEELKWNIRTTTKCYFIIYGNVA